MSSTAIDTRIKQIVSNIRNLPTPPVVFHQIQKVINDPNASAAQVASILAEDPAMSVKVLKLTNSAFYGLAREVESVKQAVVIVGMEAIKNLVLSASVLDMFKGDHLDQERQERFWRHSLATAFCCRLLARQLRDRGMVDPDSAFSAGLLHDVGKMIIECFLPQEYEKFAEARTDNVMATDLELERETLGYTHDHLGGFLALQWKLPQRLHDAIAFHHAPTLASDQEQLACIVNLGNFIAKQTYYDRSEQYLVGHPDGDGLVKLGVDEAKIEEFADKLREEYAKAETFMRMLGLAG